MRGARRLKRRRQHRIKRVENLLGNNGIKKVTDFKNIDVLYARNKGLTEKLTEEELYTVLVYLARRRGISYLDDAKTDDKKASGDYAKALEKNAEESQIKLPCQIQLERLESLGAFRGDIVNGEEMYNNVFTVSSYKKEVDAILLEQRKYYSFIDDNFIEEYNKIHSVKREYFVGPGNKNSRTNYGRYKTDGRTVDNIFSELIGKCSVYNGKNGMEEQLRASSASFTAQEFNILNDLNNLKINNRHLTKDEKVKVIEFAKKQTKKTDILFKDIKKELTKIIGEEIVSTSGVRINKKEEEIFHSFTPYRCMKKYLKDIDIDINIFDTKELDEIAHILTINTERESIINAFNKLENEKITSDIIDAFIQLRRKEGSQFNKWHSLSVKIMQELRESLYNTEKNQMQILSEQGILKSQVDKFKQYKTIPSKELLDDIYNPVVKRSINQSVKVINAIIKKYGDPEEIIIEMAREKNSDEKKKQENNFQKKYEQELGGIIKELESKGIEIDDSTFRKHKMLKTKLRLWKEQEGICLYSGKTIKPEELINDMHKFEIDHIIPISISYDDSRSNKVIVYRSENQKKTNMTPYYYLKDIDREGDYNKYKQKVLELYANKKNNNMTSAKKLKLLFEEDITKEEVLSTFKARNLNDTRYSCRVVLNTLQDFMKANEKDTKVFVLNGAFTNQIRKRLAIQKDRELSYSHHAVDAMVLCFAKQSLDNYKKNVEEKYIDVRSGEIINKEEYSKLSKEEYKEHLIYYAHKDIRSEIVRAEEKVKYSHKVDKKVNRAVSNQTIYGTRTTEDGEYVIETIKDIYADKSCESLIEKIEKDETQFLMYKNDPKTFEIIKKVIEQYSDHKNPLAQYKKEYGEIRKYSKKDDGPKIKNMKYARKKLGNHIDITSKYSKTKNKKVVLMSLKPFRTDIYYDNKNNVYYVAGIKYAHMKFVKGKYILEKDTYNEILKKFKIINEDQTLDDLEALGIEFKFSLYKNDILELEDDKGVDTYRFLSLGNEKARKIEVKPLNNKQYIEYDDEGSIKREKDGKIKFKSREMKTIGKKVKKIRKINTDVLGTQHVVEKENFILDFKLDNKMIKQKD